VVVATGKDLTTEDRQRLDGYVERVLQKGAYGPEELLEQIQGLVNRSALSRNPDRRGSE